MFSSIMTNISEDSYDSGEEPSFFPAMSYPEKMSAPDPARNEICDAIAVSPTGKAAPDHDKLNTKRTLFKSSPLQRGTTDSTTEKNAALQRQEPGRGNREEPVQKFVRGRRERGELLFWNWIHTIPDQV